MLTLWFVRLIIVQYFKLTFFSFIVLACSSLVACSDDQKEIVQPAVIDTSLCDFKSGACVGVKQDLSVALTIDPINTPSEKPLSIQLSSNKTIKLISSRVEGRDMFMGVIPLKLNETSKNNYQGTLVYGSCSSGYMVWRLFIEFEYNGQRQTMFYDFLADNDS